MANGPKDELNPIEEGLVGLSGSLILPKGVILIPNYEFYFMNRC